MSASPHCAQSGKACTLLRVKVAIDIRRLYDFGVATYIRNVVRALGRLDLVNEYFLLGTPGRFHEIGDLPPNFHLIPFECAENTVTSYLEFRRKVRHFGCDLVHIPHTFWRPMPLPCPYIMTVHDLLDYLYRANPQSAVQRWLHYTMTKQVLQKAARIFAVSNFTKQDVSRYFNIPPEKIEVTYNALEDRLRGSATPAELGTLVERYQVNYPFLLYAGRISPHKNVVRIIEAFSALKILLEKQNAFPDLKLIIIGDEISRHPDIRRAVIKSGVQHDVRFFGYVPIDVLRIFFDTAKVFIFPSLYEGFGLPPLEAMAHGTPVVTSNCTALPEVVGNAAMLVNPENVFEISRALLRTLTDKELREKMKAAGRAQAARFSWDVSVRKMLKIYSEVVQEHKQVSDSHAHATT